MQRCGARERLLAACGGLAGVRDVERRRVEALAALEQQRRPPMRREGKTALDLHLPSGSRLDADVWQDVKSLPDPLVLVGARVR